MSQTEYTPSPMQQPAGPPTSTLAILGLVFAFLVWPVGLVLSILGLREVKQTGKAGRGLALAGLIISAVAGVLSVISVIFFFVLAGAAATAVDQGVESVEDGLQAEQDAAMADVVLSGCEVGESGELTADLTITNSAEDAKTYTVTVSANDAAGNRLTELNGGANEIAPGQSAQVEAFGMLEDPPADLQCVVASANRF